MSRLTKSGGKFVSCNIDDECTGMCGSCKRNTEIRHKLRYYEDLEEQGRLLELPCKVGDKVYSVHSAGLSHAVIAEVDTDAFFLMLCVAEGRFGKTVFTTQEEAEAKLAEMEGAE